MGQYVRVFRGILLEPGIATVATHEDICVHEDVVWINAARLVSHGSEYQMWELFLFFIRQYVYPTGCPNANKVIYELPACQSVFLQEQFDHAFALLLNLFVSFTHNAVVLFVCGCKGNNYFRTSVLSGR